MTLAILLGITIILGALAARSATVIRTAEARGHEDQAQRAENAMVTYMMLAVAALFTIGSYIEALPL